MAKPTADDRVWSCWLLLLRQRNALSDPPSRLFANPPCFLLRPRSRSHFQAEERFQTDLSALVSGGGERRKKRAWGICVPRGEGKWREGPFSGSEELDSPSPPSEEKKRQQRSRNGGGLTGKLLLNRILPPLWFGEGLCAFFSPLRPSLSQQIFLSVLFAVVAPGGAVRPRIRGSRLSRISCSGDLHRKT